MISAEVVAKKLDEEKAFRIRDNVLEVELVDSSTDVKKISEVLSATPSITTLEIACCKVVTVFEVGGSIAIIDSLKTLIKLLSNSEFILNDGPI